MRISDYTLNRLGILKAILRHGPVARTDLPGLTGLSAGLITQQTAEMVRSGLVTETRDVRGRKGRPRLLLEIDGDRAIVMGAGISGRGGLIASFVSLAGRSLHTVERAYPAPRSLAELARTIGETLQQIMAESPCDAGRIARIGIALPAVLDSARGDVHYNATFPVEVTPFAGPIADIVGVPVTIENDLACMARAEHWFGHARGVEDFALIHVGLTVQMAEFANGVPRFGANGLNPEFGHVKVGAGGEQRACFCGARDCLTTYCSMFGILQQAGLLTDLSFPQISGLAPRFDGFVARALAGDAEAMAAVDKAGTHLGLAVANYLATANPATVFITVDNPDYSRLLQAPFRAALEANTMPGILPLTRIAFIQAGADWRLTGTAALALEQMYLADSRNTRQRTRPAAKSTHNAANAAAQR